MDALLIIIAVVVIFIIVANRGKKPKRQWQPSSRESDLLTPQGIPRKQPQPPPQQSVRTQIHKPEPRIPAHTPEEPLIIKLDLNQQEALDYALDGEPRILILGAAGTGKSTLIKSITQELESDGKNVMLLAPTGVAAINIGGATIHSQLEIGIGVAPKKSLRYSPFLEKILTKIDTIIIDEISMLRSDIMDAVMERINTYSPNIQLILVGDLMQLPPVLPPKEILGFRSAGYRPENPYFMDGVIGETFTVVMLDTYHRQEEGTFLDSLNKLRCGEDILGAITAFNAYCGKYTSKSDPAISIVATNKMAAEVNETRLSLIQAKAFTYEADIKQHRIGKKINFNDFPAPETIILKQGAHVMITKNIYPDPENKKDIIPNGAIGIVTALSGLSIRVRLITARPGHEMRVDRFTWEEYRYDYDPLNDRILKRVETSFTQYPLKLAWAITIHKSQGLTLENYAINLGDRQFTENLAYVALSRGRRFEDITLMNLLREEDIRFNKEMLKFLLCLKTGTEYEFLQDAPSPGPKPPKAIALNTEQIISNAIDNDKDIEFDYVDNQGNFTHRTAKPLHFIDTPTGQDGIRCHCHMRKDQRTFVIDKMENVYLK